ncbi:aminotransferase class I/II-fold pyridoxal phosphate-dependent enzyme [Ketobacter sp.]
MLKLADRAAQIKSFHVMALVEQAAQLEAQGRDIIHLEVGEPDFPTPANVVAAGVAAMQEGKTRYTAALGLPALRQAISDFYQSRLGVSVAPDRIMITPGASGAIGLVSGLLFNAGDGVLLSDPGYPCNDNFLHLVGALPQRVAVSEATQFQLTDELVQQHWRDNTRGVWLASPSNPTGTLIPLAEMKKIKWRAEQAGTALIVDEIYHCLSYEQEPQTVLSLPDAGNNVFVLNSFSKYFNMTGWRLGWLVAPQCHIPALERMAQNFYLSAPTVAQHAALEAFSDTSIGIYEERRATLAKRRDFLLAALPKLGIRVPVAPQGAFYIYCDIAELGIGSFEFCQKLLNSAGVAVTPGIDFGEHRAERYIRIAYTADESRLAQAVDRIAHFIKPYQ